MIPKVIHYCWFGHKPLPPLALKCIASWRKYLPDYEIKEWNEQNFDVNQNLYVEQAYKNKKYAFVSDFARFKIMYEYGGVYFDTDVEVVKPLEDIIDKGSFWGMEAEESDGTLYCNVGLGFACVPRLDLCKEMIDLYGCLNFYENGRCNLKTVVQYFSELLMKKGIKLSLDIVKYGNVYIYPPEFFCPKSYESGKIRLTENTRTIHHYAASWHGPKEVLMRILTRFLGTERIVAFWKRYMSLFGK